MSCIKFPILTQKAKRIKGEKAKNNFEEKNMCNTQTTQDKMEL